MHYVCVISVSSIQVYKNINGSTPRKEKKAEGKIDEQKQNGYMLCTVSCSKQILKRSKSTSTSSS